MCATLILNFPAILFSNIIYRYHFISIKYETKEKFQPIFFTYANLNLKKNILIT